MTPQSLSLAAVLARLATMRQLVDVLRELSPTRMASKSLPTRIAGVQDWVP